MAVVLGWTWDELSSTRLWAIRAALDDAWKLQATFAMAAANNIMRHGRSVHYLVGRKLRVSMHARVRR